MKIKKMKRKLKNKRLIMMNKNKKAKVIYILFFKYK